MKKYAASLLGFTLLVAAVWGGWVAWEAWQTGRALNALENVVRSADLETLLRGGDPDEAKPTAENADSGSADGSTASPVKEAVDLALRGIQLAQGESGVETWRLQADWATLRQESGLVEARDPHIRYAMGDPQPGEDERPAFAEDQYVDVTARFGRVEDNNTRISMEGEVRAEYRGDTLTGPFATYNSTERLLVFPEGAQLESDRLSGRAAVLRWDLTTDILYGESGVEMVWIPSPDQQSHDPAR